MNSRKSRLFISSVIASLFMLAPQAGMTAFGMTAPEAVAKSVLSNPEVQAKWHAFQASGLEQDASRGGFRPRLDLSAGIGKENLDGAGYEGRDLDDYTRDGIYLTLSQMLYDGNLTKSQVEKLGHSRKMRYYDLLASMEKVGMDAFRSHEDVLRYRAMANLAKENLERHEAVMKKVSDRASAGVESGVNLETTKGRLALAKVNLLTEESNLHDAATQYARVVGEMPADALDSAAIELALPSSPEKALEEALRGNPELSSSAENALAMGVAVSEQEARMKPRLDLRASSNFEDDVDGTEGRRDKTVVELLLRCNLYNGGTDEATIRRFSELQKESEENLRKAERDIRQSVLIAYNDIHSIEKQLPDLEQHKKSADAMRTAYAQQFEVGRRSLLDLLDAENEFFQANRALANARFNLVIAKARYLSETGKLVQYFKAARPDVPEPGQLGISSGK